MNKMKEQYQKEVVPALIKALNVETVMQVPQIKKVVLNIGLGEAMDNPKALDAAVADLTQITWKLKPGLLWSDGTPVTAEDSVFSFQVAGDTLERPGLRMLFGAVDEEAEVWINGQPFGVASERAITSRALFKARPRILRAEAHFLPGREDTALVETTDGKHPCQACGSAEVAIRWARSSLGHA